MSEGERLELADRIGERARRDNLVRLHDSQRDHYNDPSNEKPETD
jgi:hypothetical protein